MHLHNAKTVLFFAFVSQMSKNAFKIIECKLVRTHQWIKYNYPNPLYLRGRSTLHPGWAVYEHGHCNTFVPIDVATEKHPNIKFPAIDGWGEDVVHRACPEIGIAEIRFVGTSPNNIPWSQEVRYEFSPQSLS